MVHNLPSDADERAGYPIVFGKGQVHCCAKGPVRRGQALFARFGDDDGRLVAADEMPPSEGARVGLALAGGRAAAVAASSATTHPRRGVATLLLAILNAHPSSTVLA